MNPTSVTREKNWPPRFNAFSYYTLSRSMDSHNVGRGRASVAAALGLIRARTLSIGITTDTLFPLREQQYLADAIPGAVFKAIILLMDMMASCWNLKPSGKSFRTGWIIKKVRPAHSEKNYQTSIYSYSYASAIKHWFIRIWRGW